MKIAIVGSGGLGGFFGGLLARGGEDAHFIARGEHLQAMQRNGLTVKSALAGYFTVPVQATDDPAQIGQVDLVLVCTKTYDNQHVFPWLRPLVGPNTMILSLQNGIQNEAELAALYGEEAVLGGLAYVVTAIESPGVVAQTAASGMIQFGEMDGVTSPRTERLLKVFQEANVNAALRTDIRADLWNKFIGICAFSGVTSLTRLPIGPIMVEPATRNLFQRVLEEGAELGRAHDVALPDTFVEDWVRDIVATSEAAPWASSSMHHDLSIGRRIELETINGAASRLGAELGIPTPANDVIYAALKPYANGAPEIPRPPS